MSAPEPEVPALRPASHAAPLSHLDGGRPAGWASPRERATITGRLFLPNIVRPRPGTPDPFSSRQAQESGGNPPPRFRRTILHASRALCTKGDLGMYQGKDGFWTRCFHSTDARLTNKISGGRELLGTLGAWLQIQASRFFLKTRPEEGNFSSHSAVPLLPTLLWEGGGTRRKQTSAI